MGDLKYKCIIVDDEPAAHYVLASYIEKSPDLELVAQKYNAVDALNYLRDNEVNLMFLDIDMPEINGIEFLQLLKNPPKTILTTAYSEYALESYEYGVIDYLLKPISSPRFFKAVERALHYASPENTVMNQKWITLKIDGYNQNIDLESINYIQSYGNYVKIITKTKTYLASLTTQEVLQLIPTSLFIRIHKSYIVAIPKITGYSNKTVTVSGQELPIGITYKMLLLEKLQKGF